MGRSAREAGRVSGATQLIYVCYVLFAVGVVAYVLSLFNIGSGAGETYSDVGNGVWLLTIILLLLRQAHRRPPGSG